MVLASWIIALVLIGGLGRAVKASYATNFSLPRTDSSTALDILKASYPTQSGDTEQIVVQAHHGTLETPQVKAQVNAMLAKVATLQHVVQVQSPFSPPGQVSKDGTIGLAMVHLDEQPQNVSNSTGKALISTAQSFANDNLNVQLGGPAISNAESSSSQGSSEALGILFALVVLFFAFKRSILCAVLPLISALLAIGIGTAIIGFLTHAFAIPQFGPILAVLIALGVGVDYALFIVTRHRRGLMQGQDIEESTVMALNTAGRAVFFAGLTVCIALLGMFALGVTFLYGVAVSAALVVALTMLASLTLLPALLGFFGLKVLTRKERRKLTEEGPEPAIMTGFWARWSALIHDRSPVLSVLSLAVIVVLALPFFGMRLGLPDAGNDPSSHTTRQAYDLLAKGFGPGFNGPFTLVAELHGSSDLTHFQQLVSDLRADPGVVSVTPPRPNPGGTTAVATLFPSSAPQDQQTVDLLHRLRHTDIPRAESGTSLVVHVGGLTAAQTDFSHILSSKFPLFVGVVVILAFLLLAAVFRSLLIPLLASLMNLLSIGAALGVMVATFQYGWGQSILGLAKPGPVTVFIPVIMFAVLFGLSMDYQVFLVSRMHEEWVKTRDNRLAVQNGQAETGRVITAAALIMTLVFVSFIFGGQIVIQQVGIGFSAAILIDAFIIRTVLVPAIMHVVGKANWWLPRWLDRTLPTLHVEPPELATQPQPEPVAVRS
ncbi:MAG: MMPL family transporter [Acidimicrobiaceae bacterium]|nr:MMPL family transporter [Acidimicrobiaceae bacterium]